MSIRIKTVVVILLTIISLFLIVYAISSDSILNSFTKIENKDTEQNIGRVVDGINSYFDGMKAKIGGWAVWDDTYTYVIDNNPAYIKSNLTIETIEQMNINYMLWLDNKQKIVGQLTRDSTTNRAIPFPPSLQTYISKGNRLVEHPTPDDIVTGIIVLDKRPALVASQAIVTSKGKGPVHGSMVFVRYIDVAFIKNLASITHLQIAMYPYAQAQLPADVQQAKSNLSKNSPKYIIPLSNKQIAGYSFLSDLSGNPAVILKVTLPRSVYQQGQKSIYTFTILFGVIAFIFAIIMLILLEKTVLSRILALHMQVVQVSKDAGKKIRISLSGNDEIHHLATEINSTLDSLNQAISEQQESEEEFRNTADIVPAMIWMADTNGQATYFNTYWLHFTGRSLEQELESGWQDHIQHEDKDVYLLGYKTAIENKAPYKKEVRLQRSDGQYRWIMLQVIPNKIPDGTVISYLGAGADITEVKEAAEKVEQANKEFLNRELAMSELKKENGELKSKN